MASASPALKQNPPLEWDRVKSVLDKLIPKDGTTEVLKKHPPAMRTLVDYDRHTDLNEYDRFLAADEDDYRYLLDITMNDEAPPNFQIALMNHLMRLEDNRSELIQTVQTGNQNSFERSESHIAKWPLVDQVYILRSGSSWRNLQSPTVHWLLQGKPWHVIFLTFIGKTYAGTLKAKHEKFGLYTKKESERLDITKTLEKEIEETRKELIPTPKTDTPEELLQKTDARVANSYLHAEPDSSKSLLHLNDDVQNVSSVELNDQHALGFKRFLGSISKLLQKICFNSQDYLNDYLPDLLMELVSPRNGVPIFCRIAIKPC